MKTTQHSELTRNPQQVHIDDGFLELDNERRTEHSRFFCVYKHAPMRLAGLLSGENTLLTFVPEKGCSQFCFSAGVYMRSFPLSAPCAGSSLYSQAITNTRPLVPRLLLTRAQRNTSNTTLFSRDVVDLKNVPLYLPLLAGISLIEKR